MITLLCQILGLDLREIQAIFQIFDTNFRFFEITVSFPLHRYQICWNPWRLRPSCRNTVFWGILSIPLYIQFYKITRLNYNFLFIIYFFRVCKVCWFQNIPKEATRERHIPDMCSNNLLALCLSHVFYVSGWDSQPS